MKKGLFITFEGIEGCGKSTQAELLAKFLTKSGFVVLLTREPGGPRISEKIREILLNRELTEMHALTELFLYLASRGQHTAEWILPALSEGKIVISDRYYDSTYAYQGVARNIPRNKISTMNKVATQELVPDITFILDLPPEQGLARLSKNFDRLENENVEFHRKVHQAYLELARKEPERIRVLDGTEDIESLHKKIKEYIIPLLSPKINTLTRVKNSEK
jgi:dTMP kinase